MSSQTYGISDILSVFEFVNSSRGFCLLSACSVNDMKQKFGNGIILLGLIVSVRVIPMIYYRNGSLATPRDPSRTRFLGENTLIVYNHSTKES